MVSWYFGRNKEKIGPFTVHQIQQLASLGMVTAADHLLAEGSKTWVAATTLPWLRFSQGGEKYRLALFGKEYGPYTVQQIRAALLSGRISADAPARPQNGTRWIPVGQMSEFSNSLPTTVKEAEQSSRVGGSDMSREEAEFYLAGKRGDSIAKLVFTLQQIRKRFSDNPAMTETINKSIADLIAFRSKGEDVAT
jgi:hypothetical protein